MQHIILNSILPLREHFNILIAENELCFLPIYSDDQDILRTRYAYLNQLHAHFFNRGFKARIEESTFSLVIELRPIPCLPNRDGILILPMLDTVQMLKPIEAKQVLLSTKTDSFLGKFVERNTVHRVLIFEDNGGIHYQLKYSGLYDMDWIVGVFYLITCIAEPVKTPENLYPRKEFSVELAQC